MKRLARLIAALVGAMLIVAVAINFANVVGRYVFDKPLYWAEEAMSLLQVAFVVIGAALVTRDRSAPAHGCARALDAGAPSSSGSTSLTSVLTFAGGARRRLDGLRRSCATWSRNDQRTMGADIPLAIPYVAFLVGLRA